MKNYANYNLWANATIVNWLKTKADEVVQQEVPSSFSSIKLTLIHMRATERYWLSVLNQSTEEITDKTDETLEDVYTTFLEGSVALADQVNTMGNDRLLDTTLIVNPWFQCDFQNFDYVMQVINHTTYHRGQIITIGRNLGFTDAPMTDYNYYNVFGK
ncbi:damage-inducible protein DinB [Pedobacter lusitanus]|uniref:Damage-inducible protein DinB n=2 Tax=Pedobacter lusitanus TaxID=1503925 RepID=A0A0D0GF84_9SPHI|nr:damage-inducible protein DinB [Pedobacter lusitanus]